MPTEPERIWTVSSLATAVDIARSSFDARFRKLVGQSPISCLITNRMCLAAEHLVSEKYQI